jgi:uncharacterized membrane protein (UPF0127 family)
VKLRCRAKKGAPTGLTARAWPGLSLLIALLLVGCQRPSAPPAEGPEQPQCLPTAAIQAAGIPLKVEVAKEPAQHQMGMMFRKSLGPDEGMLFVFDRDTNLSFWMKNTYVDLDLAYIKSDGAIVQIERMKAHNLEPVFSREPARFGLEMPAGWFEAHKIAVGDRVTIPPEVAAGQ